MSAICINKWTKSRGACNKFDRSTWTLCIVQSKLNFIWKKQKKQQKPIWKKTMGELNCHMWRQFVIYFNRYRCRLSCAQFLFKTPLMARDNNLRFGNCIYFFDCNENVTFHLRGSWIDHLKSAQYGAQKFIFPSINANSLQLQTPNQSFSICRH